MGRALYRKYRSRSLDEVVGQDHITALLRRAIDTGRVAHAYLLTGPRGVGKTSIARILAHEINELPYSEDSTHLDIIEIDAASNNGVEDVRELREKVQVAPVSAKRKVYIIDEVHMLSRQAFNALLKTLEEPPEHVVFILATTDVEKLPSTIVSRTQQFGFKAIEPAAAVKHLRMIADKEAIAIDDAALELIAQRGSGSFRDSISLLDQLSSVVDSETTITAADVEQALGLASGEAVAALLNATKARDAAAVSQQIDALEAGGVSASVVARQLIELLRNQLVDDPSLAHLVDALLDVPASQHGYTKLLVVLLKTVQPKAKTAALSVSAPFVSAPIPSLAKKATQKKPKDPSPVVPPQPETTQQKQTAKTPPTAPPEQPFDWNALIAHTSKHYVALNSVLSKCTPSYDGATLTLYTGSAFYKKKLDDTKYAPLIHESLAAVGVRDVEIETIPTGPPPKDSQAAAVAAIMGGGEEVRL